ncbi:hypothetical protein HHK36_027446 [Tetracentron sinense]|uniref:BHLH domain-containing protein n=1 Tax=Tetracentron sinense TaxID=13715 RepID=A0A834YEW4_TETSI|nr:hypothetical protein HHK36_027446 [Tetracentron sinense]
MDSRLQETLKSLCCNNGWSYGVFWRIDHQNSMLLTLEDAFYEEQFGVVIEKMLQQVHMLGEGIIGQAAFTGKHRWIFSDTHSGVSSPTGSVDNQDMFQDNSEFHLQFSSGIKTIAVVPVAPQGVVQFGSTKKLPEKLEFLDYTRILFHQMKSVSGLITLENAPSALNNEIYDPCGLFASLVSSGSSCSNYWNIKPLHDDSYKDLMGKACSSTVLSQSSSFTSELHHGNMTPLMSDSVHLRNQLKTSTTEAQVILSMPSTQLPQVLLQSTCNKNTVARNPSISTWSREGSTLASIERQLLSEMGMQGSSNLFSANPNTLESCRNTVQNFQEDSTFTSSYSSGGSHTMGTKSTNRRLHEVNKTAGYVSGKLKDNQHSSPLLHAAKAELPKGSPCLQKIPGEFKPANVTTALSKPNPLNNLSQWTASSLEQGNNGFAATLHDDLSQALGVASVPSGLAGGNVFSSIPVNNVGTSVQSSITNTINSLGVVGDGKENSLNLPMELPADNDLFDSLGLDFRQSQGQGCWENFIMPVGNGSHSSLSTGISEYASELDVGSMSGPWKGFFSELRLEQLLDDVVGNGNSVARTCLEDQLSTATITRSKSASEYSNQVQLASLSCLGGSMDVILPEHNPEKTTIGPQKAFVPKSQVGSWFNETYSINVESAVVTQTKRPEEPAKVIKKRAPRPGESTRPRPKDRQQIQDRVKELREIVPNGAKCSIDALLDRTIKHMLFLQSVTKYADKLKQADEPKMIGQENGVVLKDNSSSGGGGATWAFEVGGQTMVCPIIVEDLSPPGQMLVEMLCEEQGFFLEIADIIRGFGLTILKGVMEAREEKIWARFVVEANRDVTRMDIFLSLVQLLQQTAMSGISSTKLVDSGVPLCTNYPQPPMLLPISLANRLQ